MYKVPEALDDTVSIRIPSAVKALENCSYLGRTTIAMVIKGRAETELHKLSIQPTEEAEWKKLQIELSIQSLCTALDFVDEWCAEQDSAYDSEYGTIRHESRFVESPYIKNVDASNYL